jgi:membrane protein required for colicin V production
MFEYSITFILQVVYNILKVEEIKLSYENKTTKLVLNSVLLNITALCTTFYSVKLMLSGDYIIAIIYITGSALGKWIAKSIGAKSRKSLLGPIDRVLGFGFGMLKGLIIATLIFLLFVMGYDLVYGADAGRPEWMTSSRTYPLLNASGDAMSEFVREQRLAADSETKAAH